MMKKISIGYVFLARIQIWAFFTDPGIESLLLGEFDAGELSGRRALDFNPLDNWSHHALAHNFEESGRPLQVYCV